VLFRSRTRDLDTFCELISKETSLPATRIHNLLATSDSTHLIHFLKSMEIPKSAASQILLLMDSDIGLSVAKMREFMTNYENLKIEESQKALKIIGARFVKDASLAKAQRKMRSAEPEIRTMDSSRLQSALRNRRESFNAKPRQSTFGKRNTAA